MAGLRRVLQDATDGNPGGFKDRYSTDKLGEEFGNPNDSPLGCSDCHMPLPSKQDPTAGVVDHAPGLLSIPQRDYHEHTFVGVDYDLDPSKYSSSACRATRSTRCSPIARRWSAARSR